MGASWAATEQRGSPKARGTPRRPSAEGARSEAPRNEAPKARGTLSSSAQGATIVEDGLSAVASRCGGAASAKDQSDGYSALICEDLGIDGSKPGLCKAGVMLRVWPSDVIRQ